MNEKEPTPEQLLKMLDLQLQNSRQHREKKGEGRMAFRIMAIVILLLVTMGALWVLMIIAEEMPRPKPPAATDAPGNQSVPPAKR